MKSTSTIIKLLPAATIALLFPLAGHGQNCVSGTGAAVLESGNIKTTILNGGDMFWDLNNARFEVPKGSGKHSIYTGSVWLGGIDASNGQLNLSTQTYRQATGGVPHRGFFPGPLDANGQITAGGCTAFNFVARITSEDVESHKARGLLGTPIHENEIPQSVKNWPAQGNPFRQDLMNIGFVELAPFADMDNDGVYDPRNGDYPVILGNMATYTIMNDAAGIKSPLSPGGHIEMHVMMYGFDNTAPVDVQNTIFARYILFNRGPKTLNDSYFGQWVDFDLGHFNDDFVGSDPAYNMFYAYNGDNDDEGPYGYGLNPPAQGVVFLNVPLTNFMTYTNTSSPVNGNPYSDISYHNYLSGRWLNGNSITHGGDGTGGTALATHMFDGDPVDSTGWTEASVGNLPGDRRGLGSHGPFTFASGATKVFDVAFPWARGTSNLNSVTELKQAVANVQQFYSTVLSTPGQVVAANLPKLQVYPNPASGSVQVRLNAEKDAETTFVLRDLTGRTVLQDKALIPAGQSQHRLELDKLPKGLYLLQVTQGTSSQTVKVVKE